MTGKPGIQVTVNGERMLTDTGSTIADVLRQLALDSRRIAVEHNRRVVPRKEHATQQLSPGDELEIVTFVGGG